MNNTSLTISEEFCRKCEIISIKSGAKLCEAINDLECDHWDIMSAFLHGTIDLDLYMQQPAGFEDGTERVCKLNKAIYGLCQAARLFYKRLDAELGEVGHERYSAD